MLDAATRAVLAAYPAVLAACRRREVREPESGARLSPHLAGILEQLDSRHSLTVGELARRLRVTPATVSLQLVRLVRLRLVSRTRDEQDGRRVRLRLTETGVQVRDAHSLLDPDRVREALARLKVRERGQAVSGLRTLARAAAELPGPHPAPPSAAQPLSRSVVQPSRRIPRR